MTDLSMPTSEPYGNDDWRTVRLVVEYRFRAPADWHLPRLGLDRDLPLPPMHYCTGAPSEDGGKGTWQSHAVPPLDFMTYRHLFEAEAGNWRDLDVPDGIEQQVSESADGLVAAAKRAATEGRRLIDESLELRRRALAAMPDGTRLAFPKMRGVRQYVVRKVDGAWTHQDDGPMEQEWVEDYWLRGDLVVVEAVARAVLAETKEEQ